MALYTVKSRDEVARMLSNSAANNPQSQVIYNALGRNDGTANAQDDNFFVQRGRSLENAFGTTAASIASPIINETHTAETNRIRNEGIANRDKIAQKYGYNTIDDLYTALDNAEKTGDTVLANKLYEAEKEDKASANDLVSQMKAQNDSYKDYLENNYASKKINQDQGKFGGSAIKTISTGVDVMLPAAGVALNSVQGGIEGVADELEQNGFENFDWGRAGQNAAIGATTGAVTGALNKGITKSLAGKGGNLFRGGNALTRGLNKAGSSTALGRGISTIATGAGRGAISGAVGGATGAGLSSAMNGVELGQGISNALQGAAKGTASGATTGASMAGINMIASKTPGIRKINEAQQNWQNSGDNFDERLTNTLTSGDSRIGDWLMKKRQSKVLGAAGNLGNRIQDVSGGYGADAVRKGLNSLQGEYTGDQKLNNVLDEYKNMIESTYGERANRISTSDALDPQNPTSAAIAEAYDNWSDNPAQNKRVLANAFQKNVLDGLDAETNRLFNFDEYLTDDTPTTASKYVSVDTLGNRTEYTPAQLAKLINEYDNYKQPSVLSGNSFDEVSEVAGPAGSELMNIYKTMNGGVPVDPYSRESWGEFENWLNTQRSNTPTTTKGWLKQAGKRIVEDMNNKGAGLSVKDVSKDMPEDINNMRINDYNADADYEIDTTKYAGMSPSQMLNSKAQDAGFDDYKTAVRRFTDAGEAAKGTDIVEWMDDLANQRTQTIDNAPDSKATVQTQSLDNWDKIAQEGGYADWNDLEQNFKAANPNYKATGADSGAVLTWMDENPGNWNPNATTGQTQVYDALTGEEPTLVYGKSQLGSNKKTLREKLGLALERSQVNATRKETRDIGIKDAGEVVDRVRQRTGLTDIEDQSQFAQELTGKKDSLLDNIQNNALSTTKDGKTRTVDLSDLGSKIQTIVDNAPDTLLTPKQKQEIVAGIQRELSNPGVTAIQKANNMRANARELYAKNERTPSKSDVAEGNIYSNVADLVDEKTYSSIPKESIDSMYDAAISEATGRSKQLATEGNTSGAEAYSRLADQLKNTDRTIKNFRSLKKDFVDVNKLATKTSQGNTAWNNNALTVGTAVTAAALSGGNPLITIPAAAGAKLLAPAIGEATTKGAAKIGGKLVDWGQKSSNASYSTPNANITNVSTPSTRIYDMIGRDAGIKAGGDVQATDYINMVASESPASSYAEPLGASTTGNATLESLAGNSNANTSLYDTLSGAANTTYTGADLKQAGLLGLFGNTGNYNLDIIGGAMELALMRGDETSFNELSSIYKMMASNLADSTVSDTSATKLTDKQRSANAAMDALNELENADHNFAYDLSNIPVVGNIATWGGNDYKNKADALALQVGYMLSGATVNKDEAQRIIDAYVPKPMDNEATRKSKLAQLRGIISEYQQAYAE